jgi:hypothetical protein
MIGYSPPRTGFFRYFFSDMRSVGRRQTLLIVFLLFLGNLALTLNFFSFQSGSDPARISWTGIEVARSIITGSATQPLPSASYGGTIGIGYFGIWDPFYFLAFVTAYICLTITALTAVIEPLRRIVRLAGPLGILASYWCIGRSRLYVFNNANGVRAGLGPLMLGVVILTIYLLADPRPVSD